MMALARENQSDRNKPLRRIARSRTHRHIAVAQVAPADQERDHVGAELAGVVRVEPPLGGAAASWSGVLGMAESMPLIENGDARLLDELGPGDRRSPHRRCRSP